MLTVLALMAFGGGFGAAIYAIMATLAPNLGQIADALFARQTDQFAPLSALVLAERRIAVRRWAATPRPAAPAPWREAA